MGGLAIHNTSDVPVTVLIYTTVFAPLPKKFTVVVKDIEPRTCYKASCFLGIGTVVAWRRRTHSSGNWTLTFTQCLNGLLQCINFLKLSTIIVDPLDMTSLVIDFILGMFVTATADIAIGKDLPDSETWRTLPCTCGNLI